MRAMTSETSLRLFKIVAVIFVLVGACMTISVAANGCIGPLHGSHRDLVTPAQASPGVSAWAER